MCGILAIGLFSALMVASYQNNNANTTVVGPSGSSTPKFYTQENLLVFFLVVNCLVAAPATIGFLRIQNSLLKIPVLVTLVGSFCGGFSRK